jgi:MoxR-like ATPase
LPSLQIEHLSAEDYVARSDLCYLDTRELHPLYDKLAFLSNLILSGPKGTGKSLSVASYCAKKNYPVITFDCSEDVRRSHLLGMFVPQGDRIPFVLGPLTTAFEIANTHGHCVLIFEEINSLVPQVQKILNGTTDFRRSIDVPECKRVFRLKSEAKLWVVGTMNNSSYGGTYALNEDLKSRFRILPIDYPKKSDEHKIISEVLRHSKIPIDAPLLDTMLTLAKESRAGAFEYALSTRDLVQAIEDVSHVGLHRALWILSGKFEGSDRATILQRIESAMAVGKRLLTDMDSSKLQ